MAFCIFSDSFPEGSLLGKGIPDIGDAETGRSKVEVSLTIASKWISIKVNTCEQ